MARKRRRSIRDPLHGFVELTDEEWAIVNHPIFQRLRDIRQLGMGHMVYPGANHTRFEHSLGVVYVSDRIFNRLKQTTDHDLWEECFGNSDDSKRMCRTLRIASLLHDVGHGPFSHSGERLFISPEHDIENLSKKELEKLKKQFNHETMTVRLLRETELSQLIESCDVDVEEVVAVATAPKHDERPGIELLNQLLTGELGSDRCDYLLRDAYHSGQPGGHFDLDRLMQQAAVIVKDDALYLGIHSGGWIAAEQMIANRYAAYVNL